MYHNLNIFSICVAKISHRPYDGEN